MKEETLIGLTVDEAVNVLNNYGITGVCIELCEKCSQCQKQLSCIQPVLNITTTKNTDAFTILTQAEKAKRDFLHSANY